MRLLHYLFPRVALIIKPKISINTIAALFLMGFALIYTLIPFLSYETILPDSAQNLTWGHTLLWSYDRHPPLGTWLITCMSWLLRNNELATYSSNAICLSTSLWFIFKLSKRYLEDNDALVACIFTSFSLFYLINYALQFNQNTIMLPFWVMVCYFFDSCLRDNRFQDWMFLAVAAAASILAKYESVLIITLLLFYLFWNFEYKFIFKLTVAFIACILLVTPHFISVAQHGFLTFKFIVDKMDTSQTHGVLYKHLYYPILAFFEQLYHILPAVLLLAGAVKNKYITRVTHHEGKARFNFLIYLGIAPLALVILISLFLGLKITAEWGFPLFSFTMPAIIYYFKLNSRAFFIRPLIYLALVFHVVTLSIYISFNYFSPTMSRANYPSYVFAKYATQYWQKFTNKPLKYIGGEEYIDYYLAAYLPNKPLLLEAFSLQHSPWLKEKELKKHGVMLVVKGCEKINTQRLMKQFAGRAHQCIKIPLSNKYKQQYTKLTLMVVPPARKGFSK
jgi:hypothetical protein